MTDLVTGRLKMSPAAVVVANSTRVKFVGCSFTQLGAWGLRILNASQDTEVSRCMFDDLSGGGVCVGNEYDAGETREVFQTARVVVEDNALTNLGQDYRGSTGIHTFCTRDSSISHNLIREVTYSGLSYNWPSPQGPTSGPGDGDSTVGYSRNNRVDGNDVSRYMSYMLDGGGIHTVGRSTNTSVSRNYFHDVASGSTCGATRCHSKLSQSSIYIDNWSAGFTINDNVVINTTGIIEGWMFFQYFAGDRSHAAAHDNFAANNTICRAGPVPPPRDPYDLVKGPNVTGTVNVTADAATRGGCLAALPRGAAAVVRAAGPRPTL